MLSLTDTKRALIFCILGFVLLGTAFPAFAEEARYVPGEILIKFRETATEGQRNGLLREMGASLIKELEFIGVSHHKLKGLTVEEAMSRFKDHPHIEFIEPNSYYEPCEIPNDPLFPDQWPLQNIPDNPTDPIADIRATNAWDIERGSDQIIVGVVDHTIDVLHPDLNANLYRNYAEIPLNGIDDDNNGYIDDYYGLGYQGQPYSWAAEHGTAVSSVIGASTDNGEGIAGVCWDVRIMQLGGQLTTEGIADKIGYAINYNAHILNMSFTGGDDETVRLACEAADAAGIYMVCAAGNFSIDIDLYTNTFPVCYEFEHIIGVTGTTDDDAQSFNYGAVSVDLGAPSYALTCYPGGTYKWVSGTSFAAPHVSGVLALMMSKYGSDSGFDFKAKLLETVDHLESLEGKCVSEGRVNAFLALADPDYAAPATIRKVTIKEVASNWVELEWTATGDDGGDGTATEYEFRMSPAPIRNIKQFEKATLIETDIDPLPAGSKETFVIDDLEQGTTYYIAFRVFDEWGSYFYRLGGDYSDNVSGITKVKEFTTLGPPMIAVEPTSITAATEKWVLNHLPFEIENNGVGTLDYEVVIPEEYSWITCYPATGSLQSGDSQTVSLYADVDDLPCGENSAYVEIVSNDYSNSLIPLPIELTVSGDARIAVEPASIDFGPVIVGTSLTKPFYITNRGCETLYIMDMRTDHPDYTVARITEIPPDSAISWYATFEPSDYGESDATLTITTLGDDGPETTEIYLAGEGVTPPDIAIVPDELSTPSLYTGATHEETVTIYNNGGYMLYLLVGWGGTPEWITTTTFGDSVPPGDSLVVGVTFDAFGYCEDQAGVMSINSNDPDSPAIEVPLSMTVLPASHIVSSTYILDWGTLGAIIKPIKKSLDLQNLGCDGHPLTVTSIVSSNPDVFSVITATPFTIDPGDTYLVEAALQAGLEEDIYHEVLTIYSDDPDDPAIAIQLWAFVEGFLLQASVGTDGAETKVESSAPAPLDLRACPNPFNPNTEIRFNLDRPGRIELRIYDVRGALINAIDNGHCASGPVTVPWNGSNRRGSKVASGIYFYRLMLDGNQLGATKKMILLR